MQPYEPERLPLSNIDWAAHVTLIGQAQAALARYDGMLQSIVNPLILLSPLTTQEAVLSSRIEGTQASIEDVLAYEAGGEEPSEPTRRADIQEINNYRRAMLVAVESLTTRPFSLNLLKDLHAILLDSVRGRDQSPGLFRRAQNWIAPAGEPIERATYVPPAWEQVEPAMSNWEEYLHAEEKDRLVQLAVAKAYLELVHPFRDGNGRLGRMLVPLYLYEHKLLSNPVFYLSGYLEAHRDVYYERLRAISRDGDWNGWIAFFLAATIEQAQTNTAKTKRILALYERLKHEVPDIIHSQYVLQTLDALFDHPVFHSADFMQRTGIPRDSAFRILAALKSSTLIGELRPKSGRRAAILWFPELLEITESSS